MPLISRLLKLSCPPHANLVVAVAERSVLGTRDLITSPQLADERRLAARHVGRCLRQPYCVDVAMAVAASADVNWMLSSAAQSGAALVAIVGGLLGSRYVALHGEQQAAERRLEDIRRRLPQARQAQAAAAKDWIDFEVYDIFDNVRCYEHISQSEGRPSLDDVLDELHETTGTLPREALQEHLNLICEELTKAAEWLDRLVPLSEEPMGWETFRRAHRLPVLHDDVWEWCYDELVNKRRDEARELRRSGERRSREIFDISSFDIPPVTFPEIYQARAFADSTAYEGQRNRLVSARDQTRRALDQIQAEEAAAEAHLRDAVQPEGFSLALAVLSYLAIVSIAIPSILMVAGPLTLPLWLRITVTGLFLSGVTLLMRYLFVYASFLRKAGWGTLPNSPLGLLKRAPYRNSSTAHPK